jgi:hypothetical protein
VENGVLGFHLCTLNLEKSVTKVLELLEWVEPGATKSRPTQRKVRLLLLSPVLPFLTLSSLEPACFEWRSPSESCQLAPTWYRQYSRWCRSGCDGCWTRYCEEGQSGELG